MKRLDKDRYYLNIAKAVSLRSTCLCVYGGSIIVRNDQIISTGYIGAPRKTKDCLELGFCIRRKKNVKSGTGYEMCRSVHAEMNAIINAARAGVSLLGGDIYLFFSKREEDKIVPVKSFPCLLCKKMIINAGIKRFIGGDADDNVLSYDVEEWIENWKKIEDISEDKEKYETDYSNFKNGPQGI